MIQGLHRYCRADKTTDHFDFTLVSDQWARHAHVAHGYTENIKHTSRNSAAAGLNLYFLPAKSMCESCIDGKFLQDLRSNKRKSVRKMSLNPCTRTIVVQCIWSFWGAHSTLFHLLIIQACFVFLICWNLKVRYLTNSWNGWGWLGTNRAIKD